MEFGTLMMMVRHRVHGWQMAMRSQKGLHRGTTTLNINAAGLKRMEDAAFMHHIRKPVDKPHNLNWWHFNFFWGLQGITQSGIGSVPALALTGKISGFNHPAVAHFEFMRNQISGGTVDKQILPAPELCLAELKRSDNARALNRVYQSDTEMVHDLAAAYHQIMSDLYRVGARTIQLNRQGLGSQKGRSITELGTQVSREAVRDLPADLCVQWHVTHGTCYSA
ncbi:methionine synthase [Lactiplantibacillus plantarum]|nr:methionine synthase [Lactiplantibacillus plantarum]KIN20023.1 methionine synthase [Lactiplantibacillus plantarum]